MKTYIVGLIGFVFIPLAQANTHDVYGTWVSEAGDGHIEITDCGDGTPCGKLVWVAPGKSPPQKDNQNRNKYLRERPLIGVPIIWGYARHDKEWRGGRIYNPEDGKTFKSSIKRLDDGTLNIKGCLGPICRNNIWSPVIFEQKKQIVTSITEKVRIND